MHKFYFSWNTIPLRVIISPVQNQSAHPCFKPAQITLKNQRVQAFSSGCLGTFPGATDISSRPTTTYYYYIKAVGILGAWTKYYFKSLVCPPLPHLAWSWSPSRSCSRAPASSPNPSPQNPPSPHCHLSRVTFFKQFPWKMWKLEQLNTIYCGCKLREYY